MVRGSDKLVPPSIFDIKMNDFIFVHIPKTGGTSILSKIDQRSWIKYAPFGHDPLFVLEKNNNLSDVFSFCVVRNPYRRIFSYFNHFKKMNDIDCSFNDFLYFIKSNQHFDKTPMIVYPQSFYVYNNQGEIGIDKIYRYEQFEEIEIDFKVKFEKLNVGNYTKEDYQLVYENQENVDLVKELFYVDFVNFQYSQDENYL